MSIPCREQSKTVLQSGERLFGAQLTGAVVVAQGVSEFDLPPVRQVPISIFLQETCGRLVKRMVDYKGDDEIGIDEEHDRRAINIPGL